MSSASTVTYTSVYTDSEPRRVFWGADEELSDGGPEHPPSLDYEDQPLPADASHVALSPGYVADSDSEEDPEEDPEEDHADYPADGGDGDDEPSDNDDDTDDEDEEPFEDEDDDEGEEHLTLADSVIAPTVDYVPSSEETESFETDESAATPPSPPTHRTTARISIRPEAPMLFPSEEEVERLLALPPPPPSPLISLSPPSTEERLARCLATPALPSSPLPIVPHPYGSPNYVRAPPGFRAAMGRLRASSPSTHHPLHPSPPLPPPPLSLHLPQHVPTSLPLPSSLLPPLPASLFIAPPVDRREDIPEAELPPHKRLCPTAPTSRYEVGESSTAVPRPTGGHRDTHDIYAVIEDTQDRQTQLFQRVDGLVEDRQFHQETTLLLDQEALASREAWAHSLSAALGQIQALQARDQTHADDHEGAASMAVGLVFPFLVSDNHNNMPPRRSSATVRAAAAADARAAAATTTPMTAAATTTLMTAAAVKQLIEARVSAALSNHETLRNNTNGQDNGSHNSDTGIRGTKMESVFHISNCAVENQVKFATCTFLGNALTWWNSYMKT
ncbi:hypothetical protein Tco_1432903, partial [Tanacetum coccineum]